MFMFTVAERVLHVFLHLVRCIADLVACVFNASLDVMASFTSAVGRIMRRITHLVISNPSVLHTIVDVHGVIPIENIADLVGMRIIGPDGDKHVASANAFRVVLGVLFRNAGFRKSSDQTACRSADTGSRQSGCDWPRSENRSDY